MKKAVIGIAGFVALGVFGFIFLPEQTSFAESIVETCGKEKDAMACYEREIPELYPALPVQDIFEIIREVRRRDPSYQFCHVLAHKLGESAVTEDPQNWLSVIPLNPSDGLCSNGFIHGVIVGRFRDDVLDDETLEKTVPDFAKACEPRPNWQPSGLDQAICYHGMGHLFMFITNADMRKSLDVCERVANSPTNDFRRVCREGVFMQIYQPLEPDDYDLIDLLPEKPTRENYRRLCAAYQKDEEEGACLREAWPLSREAIMRGSATEFCSGQPNRTEEDNCYETATTIIGRFSLQNTAQAKHACDAMEEERHTLCFTSVAQAFLEEDRTSAERAISFCSEAEESVADSCIKALATRIRWIFGTESKEREQFCNALPAKYATLCN